MPQNAVAAAFMTRQNTEKPSHAGRQAMRSQTTAAVFVPTPVGDPAPAAAAMAG
jgi:hypothetical protein